jgi:hypothetical protein
VYEQATLDLQPVPVPEGRARTLVIGIREPRIRLDQPVVPGLNGEISATQYEVVRALSLIRDLRASGLFRAVDFERQLPCRADVVLELEGVLNVGRPNAYFLAGIPLSITTDDGHYFARVDAPDTRFAFPFLRTQNFGGTAPLFALLPGVTLLANRTELADTFRAYLLAHEAELAAGATPDGDAVCGP